MNVRWIVLIIAALVVSAGLWGAYTAFYNDSYTDQPGVVYEDDGHNHGYFGGY